MKAPPGAHHHKIARVEINPDHSMLRFQRHLDTIRLNTGVRAVAARLDKHVDDHGSRWQCMALQLRLTTGTWLPTEILELASHNTADQGVHLASERRSPHSTTMAAVVLFSDFVRD